jgi:molybdopterin molybdotransferase
METMITVARALSIIKEHVLPLATVKMNLNEAGGLVLGQDIISSKDIPTFPQSNMDGYAFCFDATTSQYTIVGEIAAGSSEAVALAKGTAVRIFTGASVPVGADTVLMQEKANVYNGVLTVLDNKIKQGDHVRERGSEIKNGEKALEKGMVLKPASIGFLAGMGIDSLFVYPAPKIGILVTGNELQKPGLDLKDGQVYESNSYTLIAALKQLNFNNIIVKQVKDDLIQITSELNNLLDESDIVLMTGGVSVGDYDFTLKAFEKSDVKTIFHKIKQKPGKPLLFGTKDEKIVFGLPGNPSSVLTCFYEYVLPAIEKLTYQSCSLKKLTAPIAQDFKKPLGLTFFAKAIYKGTSVTILSGQESYKLASYSIANCLAELPEEIEQIKEGTIITIHLLP